MGVNLIVSKGEVVAYKWGTDRVSIGVIEAPLPPSEVNAREMESEFLSWQGPEMQRRYERTLKRAANSDA